MITDVKVLRGIGGGCDEEAKRAIMKSPPWIPGEHAGHLVRQRMVLPISFRLGDSAAKEVPDKDEIEHEKVDSNIRLAENSDKIFQIVENPASFNGGITAFYHFIQNNLVYPDQAKKEGIEGKVFVEFVVGKDGHVSNVKILRGIGAGCDEEARRVVLESPAWTPGRQSGQLVRQRMVFPISFKL